VFPSVRFQQHDIDPLTLRCTLRLLYYWLQLLAPTHLITLLVPDYAFRYSLFSSRTLKHLAASNAYPDTAIAPSIWDLLGPKEA